MITSKQDAADADGLEIFNDVRDVRPESVVSTVIQVVIAVLGYALVLGIAVVILVTSITWLWPVMVFVVVPWVAETLFGPG
jgi:hypothetical protein